MGNSKSGEKKEFEVKISHPRFTKSKIVTSKEERYLETSFAIDEKEFDKWNLLVNKYGSQRNNLMLPAKTSFNRTAMCGHTGNATVQYQNYPYLLTEEIYDRRGKKSKFTEVEVWYLLYSMVRARNQAFQVSQSLVDIRPSNIFLNQDGKIKVASSLSWPMEISNIQKAMDKEPTYLAPEDLERIAKNQYFDGPSQISQAFSIGLTGLSVGNMTSYEDLYDLKHHNFETSKFNDALTQWRMNGSFSEVLRGTVSLMCCSDPERRLTVTELNDLLLRHHESIDQKVNFVVDNAPAKLHEEIMRSRQLADQMNPRPHAQVLQVGPPKMMVGPPSAQIVQVSPVQMVHVGPPAQVMQGSPVQTSQPVQMPAEVINPSSQASPSLQVIPSPAALIVQQRKQ